MKNISLLPLIINPVNWPTWFFLALFRLIIMLPMRWIEFLGVGIGKVLYYGRPDRVRIARINLEIAFPEMSEAEREKLIKTNYNNLGMGVFEIPMSWWQQKRLVKLTDIEGLENIQAVLEQGHGAILLISHFTCLEIAGHVLCTKLPLEVVYKPARNKVFEYFLVRNRQAHLTNLISNDSPRKMLSALKKNHVIWYAPDQNLRSKDLTFAPFFGKLATAITSTSRLAKLSGAELVPCYIKRYRNDKNQVRYKIVIQPVVENFPSDDVEHDAATVNLMNEQLARANPEQYLWVHQRYKTRPEGEEPIY